MVKTMKCGVALLLAVFMLLSFIPVIHVEAANDDVSYVNDGKYIYNWGTRGETATFLSPNAKEFYTGNNTYAVLSSYTGGTSQSNAPSSDLYKALKKLMTEAHTHITSYNETKDLYRYTDCQNSGGKISSFYSGNAIGPSWDGEWNREHTWPNSKGLGGSDENDIMMLRPTSTSENSSRGNTAYGKSSGYYNPNAESGGKYDLRGDVARIFLYVYVRWGNTNRAWGQSGVMESVDVLLEWMEADPVDTWELGRNDAVEAITGTRNVFVDYPELAFLLFGEEIPAGMSTPSGGADTGCDHNNFDNGVIYAATCTEKGYTVYTCLTAGCGYSYKANVIPAKGHSYVDGTCTACGASEPVRPTFVTQLSVGVAYKLGIYSTTKEAEYYFTGDMSGYYGATDTAYDNGVDVYVEETTGGYRLYFKDNSNNKQYINLVLSGTYYNFTFATSASSVYTWDSSRNSLKTTVSGEACYIGTFGSYVTMGVLRTSKIADTDYFAHFYTSGGTTGGGGSSDTSCTHNYTSVVTVPTCRKDGYTTYTCSLCGDSYTDNKVSATGHNYVDGNCTVCGAMEPVDSKADIGFGDTANRTVFNTNQQVWVQNGVTITNNKANSQSNVADYFNPARFYMGSEVIIEYPGMTKIEIDCSGLDAKYVNGWLNATGATATNNNGIVTIVFDSPVDSFTYPSLSAQSRAHSITVYGKAEDNAPCEHVKTRLEGALKPTCKADGHTGKTVCLACDEILDEGESIPKTDHDFGAWGLVLPSTCTEVGEERRDCNNCNHYETRDVAIINHYDLDRDGKCDLCGKEVSAGSGSGSTDNQPDDSDDKNNSTVAIIVISIGAVGVLTGLGFFIKKKRAK